jgi:hypothetical protein
MQKQSRQYTPPKEFKPKSGSPGDPIVKPTILERIANWIEPAEHKFLPRTAPLAPAATPPAKGKSKAIPAWMRKYAEGGGNDDKVLRAQYGTDEARSTGAMLERMFPRGPRA